MATALKVMEHTVPIDTMYEAVLNPATFVSNGRITSGLLQGTTRWTGRAATEHPATQGTVLEGALAYTGILEITTEHGTLMAYNVGVFEPKPFGTVSGTHRISAGTGVFAGASGDFFWYGRATNVEGTAFVKTLKGEIRLKHAHNH